MDFTGQKVLSANELNSIERIPRFIFSNACESGIAPAWADKQAAFMAPSFTEAFVARGVANFVCMAWPIDDAATLESAGVAVLRAGLVIGVNSAIFCANMTYWQSRARVAKLADAPDLGSGGEILRGSSPLPGI
jgi:hypothetical protein